MTEKNTYVKDEILATDDKDLGTIPTQPKYLWLIMLTYSMIIVLASWFAPYSIHIAILKTNAGAIIFPLTFLLIGLITEVYGYKHARRTIWCGFLFNLLFSMYGQLVIHLPSPEYSKDNATFDMLLTANIRIIVAFWISYFSSEFFNAFFLAKLKLTWRNHINLRLAVPIISALCISNMIFNLIASYGTENYSTSYTIIIGMCFLAMIGTHILFYLAKQLKKIEQLDISDKKTNFNFISLEAEYTLVDNEIKR